MNDSEFNALANAALQHIEAGLEASAADLDFEMISDSVLEIDFADGSKIIV
ncbi:MAG TPA: iron donor protein CyaY, partial [Candidatus Accumulibacter sp.]|nr:iron donor protein CyaY [Accumulibacter sp.]